MTSIRVAFVLIFDFCTAEYVIYGWKMTLDDNLFTEPEPMSSPTNYPPSLLQIISSNCTSIDETVLEILCLFQTFIVKFDNTR